MADEGSMVEVGQLGGEKRKFDRCRISIRRKKPSIR